jgi:dipeptidyl aminopeptidase/acylaminoacyl peptidase
VLSRNKQNFYLLTNEEHPGKQNWYRLKTDGTKKEKITSMDGGYEVSMSPDEKWIAYRYSYINKPWELFVQENAPGQKTGAGYQQSNDRMSSKPMHGKNQK